MEENRNTITYDDNWQNVTEPEIPVFHTPNENNSFTIVSEGNRKKNKLCKKSEKKHLLETGLYPKGKGILFCPRAYELGNNINTKEDVTTILIDSDDLTSIMQFCRRVRTKSEGQHVKQVKIYVRAYNEA